MKDDAKAAELLRAYTVTQPDESRMMECVEQARSALPIRSVRRAHSLWFFIETQIKFMKWEMVFAFLFSVGLMLLLQMFQSLLKVEFFSEISVGIAPFLAVPIICSIVKSKREGMLELEAVSKIGLQRIVTVRIIMNQALAIIMIFLIWFAGSIAVEDFVMNRLLFSLISFEITSICFLWFGKSSVKTGVFFTAGWMVMMWFLLAWDKAEVWMQKANSMVLGLIMVSLIGISQMVLYGYIRNLSFESEEAGWNLGWTD